MHIAVVNLTAGSLSGGYQKYLLKLMPLLQSASGVTRLDIFVPEPVATSLVLEGMTLHTFRPLEVYWDYRQLRTRICNSKPDVIFIPTAIWLDCRPIPVVTMMRNMEPLLVPFEGNSLADCLRNLARAYAARQACYRSCQIIAVSNYVKEYIIQHWGLPPTKIGVVPHGSEPIMAPETVSRPLSLANITPERFIFTAGSIRPARGLTDVIEAVAWLNRSGLEITLVIAGEATPQTRSYQERMQRLALSLGVAQQVLWAGQLNALEMAWCFRNSAAFVMTSRAEAMSNISLEALNYGCLSVSSDQPPMPEIFGDVAYYYRARDSRSLADQLSIALRISETEKTAKRLAAINRARQYDWHTTAEKTIERLRLAIDLCH